MGSPGAYCEVNDSIRRLATAGPDSEMWEFFCECPDIGCHVLIRLTLDEFDGRRAASPPVPILAAHHAGVPA
jgi:hypothetical protein